MKTGISGLRASPGPLLCFAVWLALTSTAGVNPASGREEGWASVFAGENLNVWQRPYGGSALNEIRGELDVRASLNALMALLKDAQFNHRWVYRSGGARIIESSGYEQAYVYGIVDAPWPMSDRDTVVRFDYHQDPGTKVITITITNFPDYLPRKDALVRVPDFGGFWKLQPRGQGWVKVVYQVYGDPGGWIPVWLANRAAEISVINTLKNLPAAVVNYEDTRSRYVEEPAVD